MLNYMKPSELKKWMAAKGKSAIDVASLTHVSLRTVQRFLSGETDASPLVAEKFQRLVAGIEETDKLARL